MRGEGGVRFVCVWALGGEEWGRGTGGEARVHPPPAQRIAPTPTPTRSWKLITLLRLSPIAPWNVLNYALAVTSVPLVPYALSSALAVGGCACVRVWAGRRGACSHLPLNPPTTPLTLSPSSPTPPTPQQVIPYLLLFVYFGSLARNLADVFSGRTGLGRGATIAAGAASAVVMVCVVWYTTHVSRRVGGGEGGVRAGRRGGGEACTFPHTHSPSPAAPSPAQQPTHPHVRLTTPPSPPSFSPFLPVMQEGHQPGAAGGPRLPAG